MSESNASTNKVFNLLVEVSPSPILVKNLPEQDYHNLRTALSKRASAHKKTLADIGISDDPSLTYSLCSSYDKETRVARFSFRPRDKKEKMYDIVLPDIGTVA